MSDNNNNKTFRLWYRWTYCRTGYVISIDVFNWIPHQLNGCSKHSNIIQLIDWLNQLVFYKDEWKLKNKNEY